MNEDWKAREGRGADREQLVKKRGERRGDTETRFVGQWGLDSLTLPRLHTVLFVLFILVCLTAL